MCRMAWPVWETWMLGPWVSDGPESVTDWAVAPEACRVEH